MFSWDAPWNQIGLDRTIQKRPTLIYGDTLSLIPQCLAIHQTQTTNYMCEMIVVPHTESPIIPDQFPEWQEFKINRVWAISFLKKVDLYQALKIPFEEFNFQNTSACREVIVLHEVMCYTWVFFDWKTYCIRFKNHLPSHTKKFY